MKAIAIMIIAVLAGCASVGTTIPVPIGDNNAAVVFDIDGTLTPKPSAIYEIRPGARDVVESFHVGQWIPVYLSARAPIMQGNIPHWMESNRMPDGILLLPDSLYWSLHPAEFKTRVLKKMIDAGWVIVSAFGDSSTDFEAYANVGIPYNLVYALKRVGDKECQPGAWLVCLDGWEK